MSVFRFSLDPGVIGRLAAQTHELIDKADAAGIDLAVHATDYGLSGTFGGKIAGTFQISEREAVVEVTKKPSMAPDWMIKSKLAELFS